MEPELLITETVRRWALEAFPDEPFLAAPATSAALHAYAAGASVSEACREGRRFVRCCQRHPSTGRARPALRPFSVIRGART